MNPIIFSILACVTCMSGRGESVTNAAGMAILFMLVLLAGVFAGIFKFMRHLSRGERETVRRR